MKILLLALFLLMFLAVLNDAQWWSSLLAAFTVMVSLFMLKRINKSQAK